jgi:hypothetical protein
LGEKEEEKVKIGAVKKICTEDPDVRFVLKFSATNAIIQSVIVNKIYPWSYRCGFGIGVLCSLWVREVSGSIPGSPRIVLSLWIFIFLDFLRFLDYALSSNCSLI